MTGPPTVWSLWHFQTSTLEWGMEDDELPYLLIGCFAARATAEELRARLATRPGFRAWPHGFRIGHEHPDQGGAWDQGFAGWWDDDAPSDVLHLPLPSPPTVPPWLWDVWHFKLRDAAAPIEPQSAKGIGLFTSLANAEAGIVHRRRQPGFRDWPQGFRTFRRRLGAVFEVEGFRERHGWEAWRDSLRG